MPDTNTAATISSPAIQLTTLPRTLAAVFGCPPPASRAPMARRRRRAHSCAPGRRPMAPLRAADVPAIGAALGLGARAELQAA